MLNRTYVEATLTEQLVAYAICMLCCAHVGLLTIKLQVYSIPRFDPEDAFAFLSLVARKIGKLRKGGLPDRVQAAKVVLRDWNTGRVRHGVYF